MRYVKEEYRWDTKNGKSYYHLNSSKVFESSEPIEETEYYEDGSQYVIYKIEDNEVQTTRRRKSK